MNRTVSKILDFYAQQTTIVPRRTFSSALAIALLYSTSSLAAPVNFALTSSSSSLTLDASNSSLFGTTLTTGAQTTGSLTSKYSGTIATDITGQTIAFPGGSTAAATNQTKSQLPGIGGTGAAAAADYGLVLNAPVGIAIPSFDLSSLGVTIPGLPAGATTINLGTFQSVAVDAALRGVTLDISSGALQRSGVPGNTTFDSTQLNLGLSGTADISLGAVLQAPDYATYTINNLVLSGLASLIDAQVPNLLTVTGYNFLNFGGPYNLTLSVGTSLPFTGISVPDLDASMGKLTTIAGNKSQLTVPVSFNAIPELTALGSLSGLFDSLISLNLGLSGSLVGTVSRAGLVIPEPGSVITLGIGMAALGLIIARRKRAK